MGAKSETTVAMDYGRVTFGDDVFHLNLADMIQ